jgi:hypothetical protein
VPNQVSYVGQTNNHRTANYNNLTVSTIADTGRQSGDLLLALVATDGNVTHSCTGGTFTQLGSEVVGHTGDLQATTSVWYKTSDGTETSQEWTSSAAENWVIIVIALRDWDSTTFPDAYSTGTGDSSTLTFPSVTTLEDNCILIGFGGVDHIDFNTGASDWPPTGTTAIYGEQTVGLGGVGAGAWYLQQAAEGASGTKTTTLDDTEEWAAWTISIAPDVATIAPDPVELDLTVKPAFLHRTRSLTFGMARVNANLSAESQYQDILDSGGLGGATPKAALFVMSNSDQDGTEETHAAICVGAASAPGTLGSSEWSHHMTNEDASADEKGRSGSNDLSCVFQGSSGSGGSVQAQINSWKANGVELKWLTRHATHDPLVTALMVAADDGDFNAKASDYDDLGTTQDAEYEISGLDFRPDGLVLCTMHSTNTDGQTAGGMVLGLVTFDADDTITQYAMVQGSKWLDPSSAPTNTIYNNRCGGWAAANGDIDFTVECTGVTLDGFKVTVRDGVPQNERLAYLAISVGKPTRVAIRGVTGPTSSGANWSDTGLGWQPQFAMLLGTLLQSWNSQATNGSAGAFGVGMMLTNTKKFSSSVNMEDNQPSTDTGSVAEDKAIYYLDHDGAGAFGATTLTWLSNGLQLYIDTYVSDWSGPKWVYLAIEATVTTTEQAIAATATGVAAISKALQFARTLSASAIGSAGLTRALDLSKTLAATAIGSATLATVTSWYRTLAASAVGSAVLSTVATFPRTLAATAVGSAVISRALTLYRTLAATAPGSAVLSTLSTRYRTLTSTALGVATLTTAAVYERTLAATAIGVGVLSTAITYVKALAATAIGVPVLSKALTLYRTLAATAVGVAVLVPAVSGVVYKTIAATAVGVATVAPHWYYSQAIAATTWGVAWLGKGTYKTIAATATGVATLSGVFFFEQVIAATATGVAVLSRALTLARTIAATAVGSASMSRGLEVSMTLAATAVGVAGLTTNLLIRGAITATIRVLAKISGRAQTEPKISGDPETKPKLSGKVTVDP